MTTQGQQHPSQRQLPQTVTLSKVLGAEAELRGVVPVQQLPRLLEVLAEDEGEATVAFDFGRDDEGRRVIKGSVNAAVSVHCQRCLEPVLIELQQNVALAIVAGEDMIAQLPESLEPVVVTTDELNLHAIVEDELLLALPIVSTHPDDCGERQYFQQADADETEQRQKPFEDLADLLAKQN